MIKFSPKSRVLLNDGLATDSLTGTSSALYQLKLPPPQGPLVFSDTHPDQSVWYPNNSTVLRFVSSNAVEGYSYILSNDPATIPDNISEGIRTSVEYNNLADGIHYFHIKSLRDQVWGGTTHFAFKVDTTPPADFPMEILPSARTTSQKPVFQFTTTDLSSGMDHYEIRLEPLSPDAVKVYSNDESFFIEATSPFIPSTLALGSYDVTVRAYDKAGNYREVSKRLEITTPIFSFIGSTGIQIKNITLQWKWVWIISILILLALLFVAYKVFNWHNLVHIHNQEKKLPQDIEAKLEELKKYREKYGVAALILLFAMMSMFSFHRVNAETLEFTPPLITSFSKDISNKEIFYAGGKTGTANDIVILYLQNLLTGETISENVQSDKNGDWFYRHDTFLSPGDYLIWTQSKRGEELSPPSPQTKMTVKQTAIQFGANRLSYETIYLLLVIILLLVLAGIIIFILYHVYHGRRKHREFQRLIREADESVRRGFAVLKRDIEAEIGIVRKALPLSSEDKEKELRLLGDLNAISKHIGKEIWDIRQGSGNW